jgi:hypothetical protein
LSVYVTTKTNKIEKSNQTIIAGITYENCLVRINTLQVKNKENVYETLSKKYNNVILDKAYLEVYESLEKKTFKPRN